MKHLKDYLLASRHRFRDACLFLRTGRAPVAHEVSFSVAFLIP